MPSRPFRQAAPRMRDSRRFLSPSIVAGACFAWMLAQASKCKRDAVGPPDFCASGCQCRCVSPKGPRKNVTKLCVFGAHVSWLDHHAVPPAEQGSKNGGRHERQHPGTRRLGKRFDCTRRAAGRRCQRRGTMRCGPACRCRLRIQGFGRGMHDGFPRRGDHRGHWRPGGGPMAPRMLLGIFELGGDDRILEVLAGADAVAGRLGRRHGVAPLRMGHAEAFSRRIRGAGTARQNGFCRRTSANAAPAG